MLMFVGRASYIGNANSRPFHLLSKALWSAAPRGQCYLEAHGTIVSEPTWETNRKEKGPLKYDTNASLPVRHCNMSKLAPVILVGGR